MYYIFFINYYLFLYYPCNFNIFFLFLDVINEINKQIATKSTGRLFAVIHLLGKQFKVTESDIIAIEGNWPPQPGDEIKLEKVLLVGSKDFTLIGRPILNRELISVDAIVIQKTLSHTITNFKMKKRKQYKNCGKLLKIKKKKIPRNTLWRAFYTSFHINPSVSVKIA